MTKRQSLPLLVLAVTIAVPLVPAQPSDILPAPRRMETVETARRLVERAEPPALPDEPRDPFTAVSPRRAETSAAAPREAARPGNRQLLAAIAPLVNPTGTMRLGGEPILLFGQKRIKVGDRLPITFDGTPYILVISGIEGTSFTLRLNGEEITRPIQPANRP